MWSAKTLRREDCHGRKHCHWPQTEEIGGTGSPNVLVIGGLRSTVRQGFYGSYLYCVPKKEATRCLIITLANVDRFSKFFHQVIRETILYVHTQTTTSPVMCCYTTLWKSKMQEMLLILTASATNCWRAPEDTLNTWFNIWQQLDRLSQDCWHWLTDWHNQQFSVVQLNRGNLFSPWILWHCLRSF